MTKISTIIPIYNGEKYIGKCLDSIINQSFDSIEIIVVDDGSTDNTKEVIDNYMKKYKNIKYIYQENGRQGKARNNGLKHAQGDYISFIDGDDLVDKDMYRDLYNFSIKNHCDIVMCDCNKVYSDRKELFPALDIDDKNFDYANVSKNNYFISLACPWNKLFKRELLITNDFSFPERITSEDYACIPALAIYNPKIGYIPKPYYQYMQTEVSTTRGQNYNKNKEDIFKVTDILYNKTISDPDLFPELEYKITKHLLYYSSIDFLQFNKVDNLKRISSYIKKKFPKWYKNKYITKLTFKVKIQCWLFYKEKYNIIKLFIGIKKHLRNK